MASIVTRRSALSCARTFSAATAVPRLFPTHRLTLNLTRTSNITPNSPRNLHTTAKMSEGFSNTNVQNPDPYKQKNKEEPPLKEKVEDLVSFIERCKFCMMSTRTKDGLIASRCMALAGKVSDITINFQFQVITSLTYKHNRRATASTSSSTPTPSPARPTTSSPTRTSTSASSTTPANGLPSPARPRS